MENKPDVSDCSVGADEFEDYDASDNSEPSKILEVFNYPERMDLSAIFDDSDMTESESGLEDGGTDEKPDEKAHLPKAERRTVKSLVTELAVKIGATALLVWVLLAYVFGVFVNYGNAAYPMIKDGDLCITLRQSKGEKGDVLAFETEKGLRFGRIAAVGDDTVNIANGCVIVNGNIIEDAVYETLADDTGIDYPYVVPKDCVFLLNDYRSDTNDSRKFGAIPHNTTKGKVIFIMRKRGI